VGLARNSCGIDVISCWLGKMWKNNFSMRIWSQTTATMCKILYVMFLKCRLVDQQPPSNIHYQQPPLVFFFRCPESINIQSPDPEGCRFSEWIDHHEENISFFYVYMA
jgi:hypothetical protein